MSYTSLDTEDRTERGLEFKSFLGTETQNNAGRVSPNAGASSRGYLRDQPQPGGFWTVEYYQPYFDVDTKTVLMRCYSTLLPKTDFIADVCDSKPDMYGPFWTLTTVIFFLFVTTSLASSIASYLSDKPYDYDFTLLSVSVGMVYTYGLGVPLALWATLRYLGVQDWGLLEWWAVWGYSFAVWIPVSLLCIAPIPLLRWILVGLAAGISGYFLLRNVYPVLTLAEAKATRLLAILIGVVHLGIALSFKIMFFSYYIVKEVGVPDPIPGDKPTM
ncbi:hypothetical protein FRC03_007336 [Tulasnella sp. 419]|nr:hypothetical protein FRC03_007336 [Tulasnella sp. 419]